MSTNLSSSLIPLISKISEIMEDSGCASSMELSLPQIVVVGSQSAGKSSVLESIVGHSILPRGTGIVTRVPLVLSLHRASETEIRDAVMHKESSGRKEWAEFLHIPNEKFFDLSMVPEMISARTIELAGDDRGVVDSPIYLKVCSPDLLDLTVVDLPGITRVPVGDQPSDIEKQIRKLCLKYIEKETSIILAITAANTDISNSDSLQLARSVDPLGKRTVGVLTKIDLMDPGTHCLDILRNEVYPLSLGYFAVVNRGQLDINHKVSIRDALAKETEFFQKHDIYGRAFSNREALVKQFGTQQLISQLVVQLHECILKTLPSLRNYIVDKKQDSEYELHSLGELLKQPDMNRHCLDQIGKFCRGLCDSLEGVVDPLKDSTDSPSIAAELANIFYSLFAQSMMSLDALEGLDDEHIRLVVKNSNSIPPSILLPEKAFRSLVKEQIARLEQPGIQCVELVHDILLECTSREQRMPSRGGNRFPKLIEKIDDLVASFVAPLIESCKSKVKDMIDFELAFINTEHPDFITLKKRWIPLITKALGGGISPDDHHSKGKRGRVSFGVPSSMGHGSEEDTKKQKKASTESSPTRGSGGASRGEERSSSSLSPPDERSGPFWQSWWGEPQPNQPKPRRGGRRSSFAIMDTSELEAFRESQFNFDLTSTSPSQTSAATTTARHPASYEVLTVHTESENTAIELVKEMIKAYFSIVVRDITDKVPKAIMAIVVNHLKENLQTELITALYENSTILSLMSEPAEVSARRVELQQQIVALRKADALLSNTPSFARPRQNGGLSSRASSSLQQQPSSSSLSSSSLSPLKQRSNQQQPSMLSSSSGDIKSKAAEIRLKSKENRIGSAV